MGLRLGVIGCGLKASDYARSWVGSAVAPEIVALTDTSAESIERYAGIVTAGGGAPPRVHADAAALLAAEAGALDAVYISTPHAFHAPFGTAALDAGLDLLLEKPMALSAAEARTILDARDRAGKTIVVAYQSSLSPLVEGLRKRAEAGEFGRLLNVMGEVWEGWRDRYAGGWKQVPKLSGGGFLFDTGSHLMNAVISVTGTGYAQVGGHVRGLGEDYDLVGTASGLLEGDVPFSLNFCGDTIPGCESALTLFYEDAILRVDVWGKWAEVRTGETPARETAGENKAAVLSVFDEVRQGLRPNPSPPERSLHLAEFWDAFKSSSDAHGAPVTLTTRP